MAPECLRRTQLSEVGWQSIPHSWSGDTECCLQTTDLLRMCCIFVSKLYGNQTLAIVCIWPCPVHCWLLSSLVSYLLVFCSSTVRHEADVSEMPTTTVRRLVYNMRHVRGLWTIYCLVFLRHSIQCYALPLICMVVRPNIALTLLMRSCSYCTFRLITNSLLVDCRGYKSGFILFVFVQPTKLTKYWVMQLISVYGNVTWRMYTVVQKNFTLFHFVTVSTNVNRFT